jgi:hypothetical protein
MNPKKYGDPTGMFRNRSYLERKTPEETILYRVWGQDEAGKGAAELGHWWSRTRPLGPLQARIDSAIRPEWPNTFETITSIRVPRGTTIYEGPAEAQDHWLGGGSQVYLRNVNPRWIKKSRPF